jgi:hypothetical protein
LYRWLVKEARSKPSDFPEKAVVASGREVIVSRQSPPTQSAVPAGIHTVGLLSVSVKAGCGLREVAFMNQIGFFPGL